MKLTKQRTLSAYLEYWLSSIVQPSTRPTTLRAYSEMVHGTLAPSLGRVVLRRLTTARIAAASDRWRLEGASNRKVRTALQVLRTALRAATHRGWISADPTAVLPLPRYAPRNPRWLSPPQAARLLTAMRGHRYEPAFVLAIYAGLRRGEVGALQWKDLDLRRAVVTVQTTMHSGRGGLAIEPEVAWVARCLTDFAGIWDVLTPENRGRLLRAVVERVEVNEPANQVSVFLADLGADVPAEAASQPAQQEVSP